MKEIQYKTFSLRTHKKNWQTKRPNVCQFELTFRCGLNCNYCYASCYNKAEYIKNELDTQQVKFILDKVYDSGVIWLCFTGGDPLIRKDFLEIYSYAKDKGFIITVFTNGYSMTKEIADYLAKRPPFVIEITLNAVTRETYEEISQVKGSYDKVMDGLKMITQRKLPLKIKTQVTKDNLEELPKIKEFVENLGLNFRPSAFLHARLDGDLFPVSLRINPKEVITLKKIYNLEETEETCNTDVSGSAPFDKQINRHDNSLFNCAILGGDGINIDPYGNMFACMCIRKPSINLIKENIKEAHKIILGWVKTKKFNTNSLCKNCAIIEYCYRCPGKALLETKSLEKPIDWFCNLAHLVMNRQRISKLRRSKECTVSL
jgi:radical SAM protein with 4Fe4S-binding SPASM domain